MRPFLLTYIFAVLVNYAWELLQLPLYQNLGPVGDNMGHCFAAALGDGVLVVLIALFGWMMLRDRNWYLEPGVRGYFVMLITGAVIAVTVEKIALALGRWAYSSAMPVLPVVNVGLTPLLQMIILPPLIFMAFRKFLRTLDRRKTR